MSQNYRYNTKNTISNFNPTNVEAERAHTQSTYLSGNASGYQFRTAPFVLSYKETVRYTLSEARDIIFSMENDLKLSRVKLTMTRNKCMLMLREAEEVMNRIIEKIDDAKFAAKQVEAKKEDLDALMTDSMKIFSEMQSELMQASDKVQMAKLFVKRTIMQADITVSNPEVIADVPEFSEGGSTREKSV